MTAHFRQNLVEAIIGLLVLAVAVAFGAYFFERTSGRLSGTHYRVAALFPNATGIAVGTDVRVSGIRVGRVAAESLDAETFQARVELAIDARVRLPLDSSAVIASEGILGGNYVQLVPGGDTEMLVEGDEIVDTQGSVDLMELIGSVINRSGAKTPGSAAE